MNPNRRTGFATLCFCVIFFLAVTAVGQAAPVSYPSDVQVREQVSAFIERQMADTGTLGVSIAVIDDQRIAWMAGYGWADSAGRVPATPETVYKLASLTKLFTASAILQLAEQRKLDIDQPVQDYLPAFAVKTRFPGAGPITARTIMTHHSGMPSDYFRIDLTKPFNLADLSLQDQYVCYPPNYIYSYSNLAFLVLGGAIEQLGGQPYQQYVRENLLDPLGMTSSFYESETAKAVPVAKGYEKGKERPMFPTTGISPTGGLSSTAPDLAKFVQMLFADGAAANGRQLLTKASIDEMFRPQNENIPLDGSYRVGLGWSFSESAVQYAGRVVRHGGHLNNHAANITLLPDHKLGVVVLANSAEAFKVLGAIADETLKTHLRLKKGIEPPVEKPKHAPAKVTRPAQELTGLSGFYATELGVIRLTASGNKLLAATSDFKFELQPREQGLFSMHHPLLGGLFSIRLFGDAHLSFATLSGRNAMVIHSGNSVAVIGEKGPEPVLPDEWKAMAGAYELTGVSAEATPLPQKIACEIENNRVLLTMPNPLGDYPLIKTFSFLLQPLSAGEAVVVGLGQRKGDTVTRAIVDGVPHIRIAGLTYKRISPPKP